MSIRRSLHRPLLVVAFLVCASCKSTGGGPAGGADPAYSQDLQTMCDGPPLAEKEAPGILKGNQMDLGQKARLIVEVVDPKLKTGEGKAFWKSLLSEKLGGKDKSKTLAAEATRVGISKCEMAAFWAQ